MLLQMAVFFITFLWLLFHLCVCPTYIPHLLYSSVVGHLGCLHVLAIINSAAMNIGVHVCFQIKGFIFFWKYAQEQYF